MTNEIARNKPEKVFRMGNLSIPVWQNRTEQDGRTIVRHSTTLTKRIRDKDGKWRDTSTYFPGDLLRFAILAQRAAEWIELREESPTDTA